MARLACLFIVVSMSATLAGQGTAASRREREELRWHRLSEWIDAVERHEPGELDRPAIDIASWPTSDLDAVVRDLDELVRFLVRASARSGRSGEFSTVTFARRQLESVEVQQLLGLTDQEAQGDVSRLVGRAVLLHTDIAVHLIEPPPRSVPSPSAEMRTALLVLDGRHRGFVDRGPHWALARSLFELMSVAGSPDTTKRQWYVAAATLMQTRSHMADLLPHLKMAGRLFPDDPDVLFHCGWMNETLAAPHVQRAIEGVKLPMGLKFEVGPARTHLQEARRCFQRALANSPGHVPARVHLGRVLGLLGRHEEAAGELRRALTDASSPVLRYYAALFLGGEHSALGRRSAARDAFEQSVALFPHAQAPRLGLSSLARAEGNRAGAMAALQDALAVMADDDSRDPWWSYFSGDPTVADRLLHECRRAIGDRASR